MLNGIDISHWQKGIDLSKVKCDFVIAKATESINFVDPCFEGYMTKAQSLGKCLGFYHFARPEKNLPKPEARFFYKMSEKWFNKGIPILDWESSGKWNVQWAKQWLDEVYHLSGVRPIIYMSESVVNAYDWSAVASAGYGLWVAKYRDYGIDYNYDMSKAGKKPSCKFWNILAMWQWTSVGRLNGYDGNLDCDVFYGTVGAWEKYAGAGNTYTVQAGDKLTGIAQKTGISVDDIADRNGWLTLGQKIKL